jgi:hypothetical protein
MPFESTLLSLLGEMDMPATLRATQPMPLTLNGCGLKSVGPSAVPDDHYTFEEPVPISVLKTVLEQHAGRALSEGHALVRRHWVNALVAHDDEGGTFLAHFCWNSSSKLVVGMVVIDQRT